MNYVNEQAGKTGEKPPETAEVRRLANDPPSPLGTLSNA